MLKWNVCKRGMTMSVAWALGATFIVGVFILIGYFIVLTTKNNHRVMNFSISMAFGVMTSLVLLELLPESFEHLSDGQNEIITICYLLFFIAVGICVLKFLDFFIPDHHADEKKEIDEENLTHIGIVSSIALIVHNMIEGMAIYTSVMSSLELGILMCIGVGLHNIPMGMVLTSAFYTSDKKWKTTLFMILLTSISTFVGGLMMFFMSSIMNEFVLGILLAITTGMVSYIVIFELFPHLVEHQKEKGTVLGVLVGVVILMISVMLGHHH